MIRKTPARLERRTIGAEAPAVTDEGIIRGLAIPFDSWTTIGSGAMSFRERVGTGAVSKTFREGDVVLLDNHDPAKPIARKSAGTLEMRVGPDGARYEAQPADTTYAKDCIANIRAGNYGGMSFGFEVVKEKWEIGDDGIDERTLLEIKAPEVSICTFPAYPDTEVGMRDAYEAGIEARDKYYESRGGDAPGNGKKPYGNVTYADPGYQKDKKKRYPIDSKEHVKSAWSYINKESNASHYTSSQLSAIKGRIKAAAKKFGIEISDDRGADMDVEIRDDPDGKEINAMREAIERMAEGDHDGARDILQASLDHFDEHNPGRDGDATDTAEDGSDYGEDSSGMVAHTNQGGAAVPVRSNGEIAVAVSPRVLQRAYDLLCEVTTLTVSAQVNEALRILEPLLEAPDAPAADEQRSQPKPEPSTSAVARDSDMGRELAKRFAALQRSYR